MRAIRHRNSARMNGKDVASLSVSLLLLVAGVILMNGCQGPSQPQVTATEPAQTAQATQTAEPAAEPEPSEPQIPLEPGEEIALFDGRTLGQWKKTDFGGQGDVHIEDGAIHMDIGSYMTGITWTGPVERMNYEITLDAQRVEGNDFFCGLTFPVAENPCTLILGGWGGSVCGLSNIGYYDASENETTSFQTFENGQWYHVRLRVVPEHIQAWLDGEVLVNVETTGKKIDIRPEVDLCQPLGFATWMTTGAVRDIQLKKLAEDAGPIPVPEVTW